MTMLTMRYLREPRGKRKQYVYQRSIPSNLQASDRGRNGKPRKQIEIGLGRSKKEAVANYNAVHEQQMVSLMFAAPVHAEWTTAKIKDY
jgi:hypothetical protein